MLGTKRTITTIFTLAVFMITMGMTNVYAAAPDGVTDLAPTVVSETQVDLTWTTPGDGGSAITGYFIQNKVNGVIVTIETEFGDATSEYYTDMSLSCEDSVQYRIAAINGDGQGAFSNIPAAVDTDACEGGGGGDDLQPLWDAIAVVEAAIAQLQADFAALQTQIDNIGSTGLDVGGDIQLTGDITSTNDICIGNCG